MPRLKKTPNLQPRCIVHHYQSALLPSQCCWDYTSSRSFGVWNSMICKFFSATTSLEEPKTCHTYSYMLFCKKFIKTGCTHYVEYYPSKNLPFWQPKRVGEFIIASSGECIHYASKYDIVTLRCKKLRRRLNRDRAELRNVRLDSHNSQLFPFSQIHPRS